MKSLILPLAFGLLLTFTLAFSGRGQDARVIDAGFHHLGNDPTPQWPEASEDPEGGRLDLVFEGRAFEGEGLLLMTLRNVDDPWVVEVNGVQITDLPRRGADQVEVHFTLPPGLIRDGRNSLAIHGTVPTDDLTVGNIRYHEAPLRQVFDLRVVVVRVRDADTGRPLPARVTVTDGAGRLVELFYAQSLQTAVRQGVVYTSQGEARFEVPAGRYTVHALRGTEWSLSRAELAVTGATQTVDLELRREVDTTGFVACDTHIHTLTHSGHGDSSVEERMVTLAGEGIELAIATDHNHNTDYRPIQGAMGLSSYFTPVVGNEVTTPIGHLNAFPLDPADEVPAYDLHDIGAIVAGCRKKGAVVVILNHPRWPEHETGPYGVIGLDPFTGDPRNEPWTFPFDAMELINSQTEEHEPMLLFRDWFALLNRGERVMAAASSDSHTVGGVVGQGRTYVRSATDDPASIHVETCCENIARGRSSISMGIFCDLLHRGRSVMGETLRGLAGDLELRVASPSWVRPERVTVFVDGSEVGSLRLAGGGGASDAVEQGPTDETLRVPGLDAALERGHDFWVVCVVSGPGVGGAWWPQLNDYTLAATNPVFIDADGDGTFSSPREIARRLVARSGTGPEAVASVLEGVDQAVAVQVLELARQAYLAEAERRARELGEGALGEHPGLKGYLEGLGEGH